MEQARLIQNQDEDQEADGEEDDDDDEEEDRDRVWRKQRESPEGQGYSDESLRKRVVANREEDEEDS